MRYFLYYLFLILSTPSLCAQTLNGKIIDGIGEEGLPNVRIEVQGISTAFSDPALGTFSLTLPSIRPGMLVPLDIQKDGYAVINREATQPRLPDNPMNRIKIHMAPTAKRDELALQFYKISIERNIQVNFDKAAKEFAVHANYEAIGKLHADKESALKMADSLAARLAQFDPQSASEELTQAMQLYHEGKVEKALSMLDLEKLVGRIQGHQQAVDQDIEALIQAGGMALSIFRFDKAQAYFEAAATADPSNLDNLWLICAYLYHQSHSKKLLHYAGMMKQTAIGQEAKWEELAALIYIGYALRLHNQPFQAIATYEEALEMGKGLTKEDPQLFESYVALILSNLGSSYADLNRHEEAISFYQKALELKRELLKNGQKDQALNLASTLNKLGITYRRMGDYAKAITAYEEAFAIYQKDAEDHGQYLGPEIANTLNDLGVVYSKQHLPAKAAPYYQHAVDIYRELVERNPRPHESGLAMALHNLGQARVGAKHYSAAFSLYQEALDIRRRLVKANPERFEPDLAMTLNNLGVLWGKMKRFTQAIPLLQEALDIRKGLAKDNQEGFEQDVATTLTNLGNCYGSLDRYPEAIALFEEVLEIYQRLAKDYPQSYEPKVAMAHNSLGITYESQHHIAKAISAYEERLAIYMHLAKANPQTFGLDLGQSYYTLGTVYRKTLRFQQGNKYFQLADSSFQLSPQTPRREAYIEDARYWIHKLAEVDILSQTLDERGMTFYEAKQYDSAQVYFQRAVTAYEALPKGRLNMRAIYQASFTYEHLNRLSKTPQLRYDYQRMIAQLREQAFAAHPENADVQAKLGFAHVYLSWFALFVEKYGEAERSAKRTLELSPSSVSVMSSLALAYLFQGKYAESEDIFRTYADQAWPHDRHETFREAFLADIDELEQAGISHPDMEKIRDLLEE